MTVVLSDYENAIDRLEFMLNTVTQWKNSPERYTMLENEQYYNGQNPILDRAWNSVTLDTGAIIDIKPRQNVYNNFFGRIVKQLINRLYFYPIELDSAANKAALGSKFDKSLMQISFYAAIHGVCYGFWNEGKGQLEEFVATQFIPIVDDRTGDIVKGIKFWQRRKDLPEHFQLYEADGMTEYIRNYDSDGRPADKLEGHRPKTPYSYSETNYPTGQRITTPRPAPYSGLQAALLGPPIAPCYVNMEHRSELTLPIKSKINTYDLLSTFYMDEFLNSKFLYFLMEGGNADEMRSIVDTLRTLGILISNSFDGGKITTHTLELPYQAHDAAMQRLEKEIFSDAMVLDVRDIMSGNQTATAVLASQHPEDLKVRGLMRESEAFIQSVLQFAGIQNQNIRFTQKLIVDEESVTRRLSMLANMGIPATELVKVEPLFRGREAEILEAIEKQALGMDNYG